MKSFETHAPAATAAYYLLVLVTAMFMQDPIMSFAALVGAAAYAAVRGVRVGRSYAVLFALVAFTNPIFVHDGKTALFFVNDTPFTLESFAFGVTFALTMCAALMWCRCFSDTFTSEKFLHLTARRLPKLSLTLSMSLRLLPLMRRRMNNVERAQRALGMYSGDSLRERVSTAMRIFYATTAWSAEHSIASSISMRARYYDPNVKRTSFSQYKFRGSDVLLCVFTAASAAAVIIGAALGEIGVEFYPTITWFGKGPISTVTYVIYAAACMIPAAEDFIAGVKWKYCVSKI